MESGNGIEQEINEGIVENDSETNGVGSNVVNDDTDNGIDTVETNDSYPDKPEGVIVHSSKDGKDDSFVAPGTKASDLLVQSGSEDGGSLLEKVQNVDGRQNGYSNELQKKRPVLSQSRSFPSKGNTGSSLRKSGTVTTQAKDASSTANGSLPADQPALAATTRSRRSLPTKASSVDATVDDKSSENGNDSTLSARSTISGFNFRLDERAERRKEFFLKLEEKNHLKEVEKTNLQEQSKESQEAEIRRLRKSLTFKATPMPSFYQESGPPKVELKKIPPTRARSPKLGRRKPPNASSDNPSEASDSCGSTHLTPSTKLNQNSANRVSSVSKSSTENSFAKLPSQKPKVAMVAATSATLKPKLPITKSKVEKAK